MTRDQFISTIESRQGTYRRFFTALCCGDSSLADDISQEALIKAYLSLGSLKEADRFDGWFYQIGFRTFLNHIRSRRPALNLDEAPDLPDQSHPEDSFKYQHLYRALDLLTPTERTSILLFYMEGYPVKEIALIEGYSEEAVKQHLSRGRRHLRDLLKNQ